jgi:hypothetical protein
VSEDQIKEYLRYNLGEAPMPEWGLPNGWGSYLSGAGGHEGGRCARVAGRLGFCITVLVAFAHMLAVGSWNLGISCSTALPVLARPAAACK